MIVEADCDTQLPNNLLDDDFYPTIKELPTPRPLAEPTPISYMICKARLCFELGNILQATNRVSKGFQYDEVVRFDAKLRQIMQELPPHLKLTNLNGSHDPVTLIVARFNINALYQKIICLLHRKYLPRARQNPRYAHSRRRAIEASMEAMEHLATLHRESLPTGRLRAVSWYIKSIATKEFVMPAMLIILDLHYDNIAIQNNDPQDSEGNFIWDAEQRSKMISTLENARGIWKKLADTSMEAFKASKVIDIMLDKIRTPPQSNKASPEGNNVMTPNLDFGLNMDQAPSFPQSLLSTAGMTDFPQDANPFAATSTGPFVGMDFGLPPLSGQDFPMNGMNTSGPMSPLSMFTSVGNGPNAEAEFAANFDWVSYETQQI